jgi:hypothetical protein
MERPCNLASLIDEPDALVTVNDLIEANIVTSGQAAKRWIRQGWSK